MRKLLCAIGVLASVVVSSLLATGASIPLFTVTNSGCNEASQLMACLNNLINQLNGSSGALISFGVGGTASGGSINGTTPNPVATGGVLNGTAGPGTSGGTGSQFTPVVLNAQRGVVTFITPVGAASHSSTLMVVNSFITGTSNCQADVLSQTAGGAGASATPGTITLANMTPTTGIWSGTTTQGVLLMRLGNINAYQAADTLTYNIGFWCQ